jgi:hypothetical protein
LTDLVSASNRHANGKRPPRAAVERRADRAPGRGRALFEGAAPSPVGMRFSEALSFQGWLEVGRRVRTHHDASLWWLGDWLNHGRRMYGRRYKYGVVMTGLDYHTLRNYAMVARRFELSRRRDSLSFHHHAELCPLTTEEQDRWLDRAERGAWTRNELRRRLREELHPQGTQIAIGLRIALDAARRSRWLGAAEASGTKLEEWAIATLDAAAADILTHRRAGAAATHGAAR